MVAPPIDELELVYQQICLALGDPKRMQILYTLYDGPCNVTSIAESLNYPQPTVSRHLALLRQRGMLDSWREGTHVLYQISDKRIIDILDAMRELLKDTLKRQSSVLI